LPARCLIEYNSTLPFDEALTQPYESAGPELTNFSGASLGALEELAQVRGYELVHTDFAGVNAFFVLREVAAVLPRGPDVRHGINYYLMSTVFSHPASPRTDWARPRARTGRAPEPEVTRPMACSPGSKRREAVGSWMTSEAGPAADAGRGRGCIPASWTPVHAGH
jgi:hypothetical protein